MGLKIKNKNSPWFLIFIIISSMWSCCHGADTLSSNQSLSGDQTLVSAGDHFVLGFFQRQGNSSSSANFYIGMWYKKVSTQTIVWVANKEAPVSDKHNSELRLSEGNLVLFNEAKVPIWSTGLDLDDPTEASSVEAVLGDDGNLVLKKSPNSTDPLWQSFDHPTHTWLPGSKIGFSKKTNKTQLLSCWRSDQDPAPGRYALELASDGSKQYLIFWNQTEQYWTSGPWSESENIFTKVPEMRANYIYNSSSYTSISVYNFRFVDNENESYFTYSLHDNSIISRFVMGAMGRIQQLSWLEGSKEWNLFWSQPKTQCEVYALCGSFGSCNEKGLPFCSCLPGFAPNSINAWNSSDYSGGCARKTSLQCGNASLAKGKRDGFLENPAIKLPRHSLSVNAGSAGECEQTCLNNCTCTAYAYDGGECQVWLGDLLSTQQLAADDSGGKTLYLRVAASELKKPKTNSALIIGVVVLLIVLGIVIICLRRGKSKTRVEGSLVAYAYRDLQGATKNFSERLGGGGFGSVFKGTLPDSSIIAVKKLESISQGEKQFRSEVSTIGTIQHVNLVRLRGFCSEGAKKLLVYDFMENGSLETHLFNGSKTLPWKTRYQIALGIARGLVYLHEKCRDCIIHCDIKPENILLGPDFTPKVADFGLAKLVGRDFSRVLTTMRGTRGYLAPEWISGVAITPKADVYSFGMMLFEVVSGRRNTEQGDGDDGVGKVSFFPTHAAKVVAGGGDVMSLLDPKLAGDGDEAEIERVCKVAGWCAQDDEAHRPSMSQIVQVLEGVQEVGVPPIPRSLQVFVENHEHIVFFTESSSSASQNTSVASSQSKSVTSSSVSSKS